MVGKGADGNMGRNEGTSLAVKWTDVFSHQYAGLSERDLAAVDRMLDRLALEHSQAPMRGRIGAGVIRLWATPRIYTPGGICRITWQCDYPDDPQAVVCWTVASVESR